MKGMMDGWHGDEDDVELTYDERYELECQKADEQNDELYDDWSIENE